MNCPQDFEARMKFYENYTENNISIIPPTHSYIVKLDGRGFSKLLRMINENSITEKKLPFSNYIKMAFEYTIADLIKEFHATSGYNYLDKILLVFPEDNTHIFGGRISKLQSVISTFATSRFIVNLTNILETININNNYYDNFLSYMYCKISFVSKTIVFPDFNKTELINYLAWHNNILASRHFKKHLFNYCFDNTNYNINNIKSDLLTEYNVDYDSIDYSIRHGVFIKRQINDDKSINYIKFIVIPKLENNIFTYEFIIDKSVYEWEYRLIVDVDKYNVGFVDINNYIPIYNQI